MVRIPNRWFGFLVAAVLTTIALVVLFHGYMSHPPIPALLTDPFLQYPTPTTVQVVWFTEFEGTHHWVDYGDTLQQRAIASTTPLSRVREDARSRVGNQTEDGQLYSKPVARPIWRHEASVSGLTPGQRQPYRVHSLHDSGQDVTSDIFTLAPTPPPDRPLTILLTSDHQGKPMTAANLQKVVETVGQVDAVFLAGDLVNIPDRASEWFDDWRGNAFFPCLQGRATYDLERNGQTTRYSGGALIQSAPLFLALGNHEVMGRFSTETGLNEQFNDPYPRSVVLSRDPELRSESLDPEQRDRRLKDQSFNTDTVEELFSLPTSESGGERYYAVSLGNIRLISLFAANIWRSPNLDTETRGRYQEREADLPDPDRWGYGQHIFEAIAPGSEQYKWLVEELQRPEFRQARYKMVMLHYPPHSLGDNIVPAYTNPVQQRDRAPDGTLQAVRYDYPKAADYLIRDVMPLLEDAGVQLVFYGHSHLWNRFVSPKGMHFLETSNVGNTYGAYMGDRRRQVPRENDANYVATGDPNQLQPILPTLAPIADDAGQIQPYIASDDITVFTLFHTATGGVSSYRFDTRDPQAPVIKFDEFFLVNSANP